MKADMTHKSAAFKRQQAIGRRISLQLAPVRTQQEVADILGLSAEGVRKIEYRALFKLAARIREEMI